MNKKDNILQELKELQSMLAEISPKNCYTIPEGYFEMLPAQVLSKIKATEATNAADELAHLSPLLSRFSKTMPYSVPADYFDKDRGNSNAEANETIELSVKDELEKLSPLLSSLNKQVPFAVPQGYFETLTDNFLGETKKPTTKVVSLFRQSWFRYAAAAVVTGVVFLAGYLIIGGPGKETYGESLTRLEKKIKIEIKKTSDKELNDFIQQFSDAGFNGEETAVNDKTPDTEIKELLKDIPETELKEFLNETSEIDLTTDEITLMN